MCHNNRLFWIRDRGSRMRDPGRVIISDHFRGFRIPDPAFGIPYLGSGNPGSGIQAGIRDTRSGIRDPGGAKLIIFQDPGSN